MKISHYNYRREHVKLPVNRVVNIFDKTIYPS